MLKSNRLIIFFLLILLLGEFANAQHEDQLKYLDNYYQNARSSWKVPGMSISIIHDGEIIFEKGYGFADTDTQKRVDVNTLFAIASNTKTFTASAIAKLVQQDRLSWKDKVREHLPWFEMKDPYVGRELTIEDILSHRSGLKTFSGDLLWFGSDKSPFEIVSAARYLEPSYGFRSKFGYSNIMYITAGLVIESVTDTSFAEYIQHHFLDPLKMNETLTSVSDLVDLENVASPYYLEGDSLIELEWLNWDNAVAAGGLISSVHDMTKWLLMNINRGTYNEIQYISDGLFEKLTTPHINKMINSYTRNNQPSKHFSGYGLGWSLSDYHGYKIISHGGGYDGMISKTCIVPEKGFGMVVLTNSINYLPSALVEKTLDVFLANEMDGTDYVELYLQSFYHNQKEKESIATTFEDQRNSINPNHLPLEEYVGTYRDKMYGDIEVRINYDKLNFKMNHTKIFHAKLNHWNDHIFTFRFNKVKSSLPPGKLWFEIDKNGKPGKLLIDIKNPDFDFREFEFNRVN